MLHLRGILVYAWTVDLADDMRRLRDMGVDGIITNCPDVLHCPLSAGICRCPLDNSVMRGLYNKPLFRADLAQW